MQRVSEVMTRQVQFISPRETVRRAAQMMDDLNVGALPVCDGDRLIGMVTDRDITVRASSAGMVPDDTVVDSVMSGNVVWCFEDQPLDEVMQQMADTQIRRVPVVTHDDAHRLVGMLSLGDVATRADGKETNREIGRVMESVSYPSEPDRTELGASSDTSDTSGDADEAVRASDVATGNGLAGSDILSANMTPDVEVSSTADPSDRVEVTPDQLVNRNAPGSTSLTPPRDPAIKEEMRNGVLVRHVRSSGNDSSTGESGASAGVDVDVSGASGGTAGTAGSGGTGVGAKP